MKWFERISSSAAVETLAAQIQRGGTVSARGSAGSSSAMVVAALARRTGRTFLVVCAHIDEVDPVATELSGIGLETLSIPALESLGGGTEGLDLVAERARAAERLRAGEQPSVIVASIAALMQSMPAADQSAALLRIVRRGERRAREDLLAWLGAAGYGRVSAVESPGEFAVRGGIVDVFPAGSLTPVRLDYFGSDVESLHEVDLASQASDRAIDEVALVSLIDESTALGSDGDDLVRLCPTGTVSVLMELGDIMEQARGYWERLLDSKGVRSGQDVLRSMARHMHAVVDIGSYAAAGSAAQLVELPVQPVPPIEGSAEESARQFLQLCRGQHGVIWADSTGEVKRLHELLSEAGSDGIVEVEQRLMRGGFLWVEGDRHLCLLTGHELLQRFGRIERRRARLSEAGGTAVRSSARGSREAFLHFEPGDYVVHRDQGIGRYVGLKQLEEVGERAAGAAGAVTGEQEFLAIEYAEKATLFVPMSKSILVQRYIGAGAARPKLSVMGSRRWRGQREQVAEAVKDLAAGLLRVQAVRESTQGCAFPADSEWQSRFESEFPFEETPDQRQAIDATKRDMERLRPMDRLICGDVGFGKTEVAIRAAFKCCEARRQVAILVPTTVLAEQHARNFSARFRAYPFRVECLNRFKTDAEARRILEDAAAGRVDVLVGTHRLLSSDVRFHDLGLVVVDEEQRFGVEHKQRLLELRLTADVLTLSATPIPRTLHMAMLGLRDISSLTTPPLDRRPIVTEVTPWNNEHIAQAIARELAREGQVYFVHNRVYDIEEIAADVQRLAPGARIVVGHGQMADGELERVMVEFLSRRADILVCTTIIESGLDIPTANTIIIDDAHRFGLAELHQLRGRVGRSRHRAYCYLLLDPTKPITPDGVRRLRAIEDYSMLGAGFKIAVRDLEIRGAGNLLGAEQSGHIAAVGYEMYCQLLEEAVHHLRHEPTLAVVDTHIELGAVGAIPSSYIPSDRRRIEAWRRVGGAQSLAELDQVFESLASAYGELPAATRFLHSSSLVRLAATLHGVRMLMRRGPDLVFRTNQPAAVDRLLRKQPGTRRRVTAADNPKDTDVHWRPPEQLLEPEVVVPLLERLYRAVQ